MTVAIRTGTPCPGLAVLVCGLRWMVPRVVWCVPDPACDLSWARHGTLDWLQCGRRRKRAEALVDQSRVVGGKGNWKHWAPVHEAAAAHVSRSNIIARSNNKLVGLQ